MLPPTPLSAYLLDERVGIFGVGGRGAGGGRGGQEGRRWPAGLQEGARGAAGRAAQEEGGRHGRLRVLHFTTCLPGLLLLLCCVCV